MDQWRHARNRRGELCFTRTFTLPQRLERRPLTFLLVVIERSLLADTLEMENLDLTHTLKDEATILQNAPKMGVREVVLVDRGGDGRAPMISVRGV